MKVKTKVIFNAWQRQYEVHVKKWFVWDVDSVYKFDDKSTSPYVVYYRDEETAKRQAIERAEAILLTKEVWVST